jgi:hypothetical protein
MKLEDVLNDKNFEEKKENKDEVSEKVDVEDLDQALYECTDLDEEYWD